MIAPVQSLTRNLPAARVFPRQRIFADVLRMGLLQLVVWTFFAFVFIPQTYFSAPHHRITVLGTFFENVLAFYPWILISPLVLWLCDRYPLSRHAWPRNLVILLAASVPISVLEVMLLRA